jgi:hypothetical protein
MVWDTFFAPVRHPDLTKARGTKQVPAKQHLYAPPVEVARPDSAASLNAGFGGLPQANNGDGGSGCSGSGLLRKDTKPKGFSP